MRLPGILNILSSEKATVMQNDMEKTISLYEMEMKVCMHSVIIIKNISRGCWEVFAPPPVTPPYDH